MPAEFVFKASAGFLLSTLGNLVERSWNVVLGEHGLTLTQHAVLVALGQRPNISQRELAAAVAVDPRNIVPVVGSLVARKLVRKSCSLSDRRATALTLTTAGESLLGAVTDSGARARADYFGDLTSEEQNQLVDLLSRVYATHVRNG